MDQTREQRLIEELLRNLETNAPKAKLAAVRNYLRDTTLEYSSIVTLKILEGYEERATSASERGREFAARPKLTKAGKASKHAVRYPGFASDGYACTCSSCGHKIASNEARFFEKVDGTNRAYCALVPGCHPPAMASVMAGNRLFTAWRASLASPASPASPATKAARLSPRVSPRLSPGLTLVPANSVTAASPPPPVRPTATSTGETTQHDQTKN